MVNKKERANYLIGGGYSLAFIGNWTSVAI